MTEARCINVVDGDTIDVLIDGEEYRVRYIGIDTPETPGDCYSQEAMRRNEELVLDRALCLEKDVSETDRYGRLLRYVYVNDVFVNTKLVSEGYALASTYPPDVEHAKDFVELQREAAQAGRGLWASCTTPTPSPAVTSTPTQVSGPCPCHDNVLNCSDFATQAEAQVCYDHCVELGQGDVHRLDSDGNGVACEGLQ
jgi:endonuclease YncB( thermonuclease family)